MADPAADYLRSLNTSDRVRAAAWDAVYASDDATAQKLLRQLPFSDDVRANLWDLRQGGTLTGTPQTPKPASAEQFMDQPPQPEGSAAGRFLSNAGEMLNPVSMVQGVWNALPIPQALGGSGVLAGPVNTLTNIAQQQGAQFGKAYENFGQGRYSEAFGHAVAGALPLVGPAAAEAGEQIASGDVAGGFGKAAGILAPIGAAGAAKRAVQGSRAVLPATARTAAADALEGRAAANVADVMSPKVGPNKVRFGNQAEQVAPQIAKDLAAEGAPLTREGLHEFVGGKLAAAEQGLDAAAQARNPSQVVHTAPILRALKAKLAELTSQTHRIGPFKAGADVVPGPNAARAAAIQQAIGEVEQLGPVANYEALRRIRQAYDGPAKAVYSPSMTADYLKAQGGKLGAADVTGTLREALAQWDPQTAAANADYSVYRTANDVLEATREVERTRPRVGRLIANRIFATVAGGQSAGAAGAVAGYVAAPALDAGAAMGATAKLKIAALQQQLADAIRSGSVQRVNGLSNQIAAVLKREVKTTAPVQVDRNRERATSPSGFPSPTTAPAQ